MPFISRPKFRRLNDSYLFSLFYLHFLFILEEKKWEYYTPDLVIDTILFVDFIIFWPIYPSGLLIISFVIRYKSYVLSYI